MNTPHPLFLASPVGTKPTLSYDDIWQLKEQTNNTIAYLPFSLAQQVLTMTSANIEIMQNIKIMISLI
jgi:hypothetical protein